MTIAPVNADPTRDDAPIRIVPMDLSDARHAQGLCAVLDDYARDPMGGGEPLAADVLDKLPAALAARPNFFGWLAFDGDRAVAVATCFEGFSTFRARPLMNVHDLAVVASHRGRGLGAAMLEAVERAARERDCCKMTLEVLSNNEKAQRLYARVGFAPYVLDPAQGQARVLEKRFY